MRSSSGSACSSRAHLCDPACAASDSCFHRGCSTDWEVEYRMEEEEEHKKGASQAASRAACRFNVILIHGLYQSSEESRRPVGSIGTG
eukprot:754319-Hanusia_phi.AAC.3